MTDPELRRDALTGAWVAIAAARQDRPNRPTEDCPFCVGGLEAPAPYRARAFTNRWSVLVPGPPADAAHAEPDRQVARGAAEVILYSPDHDASLATLGVRAVREVVDLWAARTTALLERPEVAYVLVFENRGRDAGATIDHPHGQVYAFPFVPPVPARELEHATRGCPVCAELSGAHADGRRLVVDTTGWRGWVPYASGWPYGLLLASTTHRSGLPELDGAERDGLAAALVDVVARYDALFGRPFPYMLWVHQVPSYSRAHLHVHLAPPRRGADAVRYVAAGELGSGTLFNPLAPEDAAAALRAAGTGSVVAEAAEP